jgi:hypothetical protein
MGGDHEDALVFQDDEANEWMFIHLCGLVVIDREYLCTAFAA